VGKQGETATNKDNNINKMIVLHCCHISPNMACPHLRVMNPLL